MAECICGAVVCYTCGVTGPTCRCALPQGNHGVVVLTESADEPTGDGDGDGDGDDAQEDKKKPKGRGQAKKASSSHKKAAAFAENQQVSQSKTQRGVEQRDASEETMPQQSHPSWHNLEPAVQHYGPLTRTTMWRPGVVRAQTWTPSRFTNLEVAPAQPYHTTQYTMDVWTCSHPSFSPATHRHRCHVCRREVGRRVAKCNACGLRVCSDCFFSGGFAG